MIWLLGGLVVGALAGGFSLIILGLLAFAAMAGSLKVWRKT